MRDKKERCALSGKKERSLVCRYALSIAFAGIVVCGASALEVTVDADVDRTMTDEAANAPYVLATATDGFGGTLPALSSANWRLRLFDDGKTLVLHARHGTAVIIR